MEIFIAREEPYEMKTVGISYSSERFGSPNLNCTFLCQERLVNDRHRKIRNSCRLNDFAEFVYC